MTTRRDEMKTRKQRQRKKETGHANKIHAQESDGRKMGWLVVGWVYGLLDGWVGGWVDRLARES